jgi:hypothetical protein
MEHRVAAAGAGAQLDEGFGDLQPLDDLVVRGVHARQRHARSQQETQRGPRAPHALQRPHCVLQAPVLMSAGVNRLAAAELNSSCPEGIGRVIQ